MKAPLERVVGGIAPQVTDILVTVIVTHFNYSHHVGKALNSVLAQTHKNFECVVVDDCSDQKHVQTLRKVIGDLRDKRFKLIELTKNAGQTHAIFEGLQNSSGDFVCIIDPDDLYAENFLEKMLQCHLNPCIYAPVAGCEMGLFRMGGSILTRNYTGFKKRAIEAGELPQCEASAYDFGFSKYYPPQAVGWLWGTTSSLMFRRDALELLRRKSYMPFTKIEGDTYCVYGSHFMGGTLFLDETLSWRGIHAGNAVESDRVFASTQKKHHQKFVDSSRKIKLFVMTTILEGQAFDLLRPENLVATLKSQFTKEEQAELLSGKKAQAAKLALS
jgi:glycosyltransferase involved in cell wall biosynthesis